MADRPLTRVWKQPDLESSYYHNTEVASTSSTDENSDDWQPQTPSQPKSSRSRRAGDETLSSPSVTVSRLPPSPPKDVNKSIRLKVKMPSSKLKEVTGGPDKRHHNIFTESVIMTGPRNSRSKKTLVEVDTDEDEDVDESMNEDDEEESHMSDADGTDDEGNGNESEDDDADVDVDADAETDADADVDMDDIPPIAPGAKQAASRPIVTVTPAGGSRLKNMNTNMDLDGDDEDDDEELSELDSDADADGEPDETAMADEASEIVEEEEIEDDEDEEEEELESDSGTPITGSRASTPDVTKMTKRQRGRMELGGDFLQLPMEPQVKRHLTAEEHAMRRAEMARRRKNLSEKRNEEEKMDTINKLLKKQAPKRRGKISAAEPAAGDTTPGTQELQEPEKPDPIMIRYVSNRDGCRIGIPQEWFGTPAGRIFEDMPMNGSSGPSQGHKLVEEV
ncbi:hypothetical protein I7I50_02986 [Histoplasma capsulatum G186AR]|uniref:INO80 complex subunit B-like conserved region domain-containing protein n=1 Tax=Ajellomyces capsulatus TaxID=5037 RepID=A0A8H7Z2L2_AJECA|nr:hypothetical protein I7I52_00348 [Histoplasma capsulatum]QSS71952.1 hypothetical protein I7I50_02986 [Histoplasma capsulatum G186AR]